MGLLNNNVNEEMQEVKDCIGLVGLCEYVTDPKTQELHIDKVLFRSEDDLSDDQLEGKLNGLLAKDDLSNKDISIISKDKIHNTKAHHNEPPYTTQQSKPTNSEEVLASALKEILERLISIEEKLK